MSKPSQAKALRRRKRQIEQSNKQDNFMWKRKFQLVAFFNNFDIKKVRLPSGLFAFEDARVPRPTQDPSKSNRRRHVERRVKTGRLKLI